MGKNISKLIPSIDVAFGSKEVVSFANVPFGINKDVDPLPIGHLISASK